MGLFVMVDRLLRGCHGPTPFELVHDGDLLLLLERMLNHRGLDTVRISKVKGHADDAMVLHGQVRGEDRLGNDAADEAADFGPRSVNPAVIDARRNLSGVRGRWYPIVLDLHRFFIAISRAVSPWADTASESASYLVEAALGDYSSRMVSEWSYPCWV